MRRPSPPLRPACLAVLAALVAPLWAGPCTTAGADSSDGTLVVVVHRDSDLSGTFDPGVDRPQAGIPISVTDPAGHAVTGTTDEEGRVLVQPTAELSGGRYVVTAEIPGELGLAPVLGSETFAPPSSTVDVTTEDQTVRLGVAEAQPERRAVPIDPPPEPPESVATSAPATAAERRFAVGGRVWSDLDRNGRQDAGEPAASRTSVQLLGADGTVLASATTGREGRYRFEDLGAGLYAVRFAGIEAGSRLSPPRVGAETGDSDPDYTGSTPPFELAVGSPGVRATSAGDDVRADYLLDTVDAGIARLRYAVGSVVWQDHDRDGLLDPDEPGGRAHISLLTQGGAEVAATDADDQGRFVFANLDAGWYRLRFSALGPHRRLTSPPVGGNPAIRSAADPATRTTKAFHLHPSAPGLVPADAFGEVDGDFVATTLNVGTVGSYVISNRVWRDADSDGVADASEPGVAGVRVDLLDKAGAALAKTVTDRSGSYVFDRLSEGEYRLRFSRLPKGLYFTAPGQGEDRSRDSDVYGDAVTAPIVVGEAHPVENGVAAGLTTLTTAAVIADPAPAPVAEPTIAALPTDPVGRTRGPLVAAALGLLVFGGTAVAAAHHRRRR